MNIELNMDALRSVFLQEADEGLVAMEQALLANARLRRRRTLPL